MGNKVEACAQCVCDHLQRPDHPDRKLTDAKVRSAVYRTVPPRWVIQQVGWAWVTARRPLLVLGCLGFGLGGELSSSVGLAVGEDGPDRDQEGMLDGYEGAGWSAAGGESLVAALEERPVRPRG